jgi:hypothetical protein
LISPPQRNSETLRGPQYGHGTNIIQHSFP